MLLLLYQYRDPPHHHHLQAMILVTWIRVVTGSKPGSDSLIHVNLSLPKALHSSFTVTNCCYAFCSCWFPFYCPVHAYLNAAEGCPPPPHLPALLLFPHYQHWVVTSFIKVFLDCVSFTLVRFELAICMVTRIIVSFCIRP